MTVADWSTSGKTRYDYTGTAEAYNGQIAELILFRSVLSLSDRQQVEAYLNATYVPEPASIGLLGIGAAALLARRRRS